MWCRVTNHYIRYPVGIVIKRARLSVYTSSHPLLFDDEINKQTERGEKKALAESENKGWGNVLSHSLFRDTKWTTLYCSLALV